LTISTSAVSSAVIAIYLAGPLVFSLLLDL